MKKKILLLFSVGFFSVSGAFAQNKFTEKTVQEAEIKVQNMAGILKRLLREKEKARNAGDMARVNCVTIKSNLVKGLLKASERAKMVMMEAAFASDKSTTEAFQSKIGSYSESASEIESSLDDCLGEGGLLQEGMALVYVAPDMSEDGFLYDERDSPLSPDGSNPERTNFPEVPAASPFR